MRYQWQRQQSVHHCDHATLTLVRIEKTDAKKTESITRACQLPVGWTMVDGQAISPWASLGDKIWPKSAKSTTTITCAKTGRPAFLCGDAVAFTVKPRPPKQEIQWTNPDGDGDYAVTVSNKTDKPVQVPALLTDGKEILWANSLVIICQDQVYPLPGYRIGLTKLEPVTLPPNGSVTGTVNPLALTGPEWPRGGYRISFQFCLGEKSVGHSFYYMSRHHDRIRDALQPAH